MPLHERRKPTRIDRAEKILFIWIVIGAAICGALAVALIRLLFNL